MEVRPALTDDLARRGYAVSGDVFASGRPDRPTVTMVAPWGEVVVTKRYPSPVAAHEALAAMQEVWRSSFGCRRKPPGLPRPLEVVGDTLVMERVGGRPLVELDRLDDHLDDAVALLVDLHTSDACPAKRRTARRVVASIRRKAKEVEALGPLADALHE